MPQFNRVELGRMATESGFVRDTFEKVLRLKEILRFLNEDALHYNYQNAGGNRDMIKIELNYSLRAHIFEPVYKSILSKSFDDGMKICMINPMEIFAAKGNALITRAAARDLYDWCNMMTGDLFENQRDLFRKCFIFYMTISADTINKSFDTSVIDTIDFNKIRRDLFPVLNKKEKFLLDERKKLAKDYIAELMVLTAKEQEYLENFEKKKYMPEFLFEDAGIIERVKNHPMALWKCKEKHYGWNTEKHDFDYYIKR